MKPSIQFDIHETMLDPSNTIKFQKVSEYDQEIPQSPTADQPKAPWGRATEH